jgi:hypothetical protein
MNKTTTDYFQ